MPKAKTTNEFIIQAKAIHGELFDYSLTEYIHWSKKVKIICKIHGELTIRPNDHIQGGGCNLCAIQKRTNSRKIFIETATAVHGDLYDYSKVVYKGNKTKVDVICKIEGHGVFSVRPDNHATGQKSGCPVCAHNMLTLEQFKQLGSEVHNEKYSYDMVFEKQGNDKVAIICPIHGIFKQAPWGHVHRGEGCPQCGKNNTSQYEILSFLKKSYPNIEILSEERIVRPEGYKKPLELDIYFPNYNIAIEYNGIQHYKPVDVWGGESALAHNIQKDDDKKQWCDVNKIRLIEIPYTEFRASYSNERKINFLNDLKRKIDNLLEKN